MTLNKILLGFVCLSFAFIIKTSADVLITRDGTMMNVRIVMITSSQVTFVDLDHKKRGKLNAPTDYVYMIMKEKGNNIFFDEQGNQTTSPSVKIDKHDNLLFLNEGEMYVVYNVSVDRDAVRYQLKDKKNAPWYAISKEDAFMIKNSDGTATLFNNAYENNKQATVMERNTPKTSVPIKQPRKQTAPSSLLATSPFTAPSHSSQTVEKSLVVSDAATTTFTPAPNMTPTDLEIAVNAKNPYTLYRKGSIAEYCILYEGKQSKFPVAGWSGATYFRQIVKDEKIENGLLVAYIGQELYNKEHQPMKGVPAAFKELIFPTEIDTAGTYHFTHNFMLDFILPAKRRGYAILVPSEMQPGEALKTSTIYDNAKNGLGGIEKIETVYSDWKVEGHEQVTVPAGTFDCIKLTGNIARKIGSNSSFTKWPVTWWIARGIGIVKYQSGSEYSNKEKKKSNMLNMLTKPKSEDFSGMVVYLNSIELK